MSIWTPPVPDEWDNAGTPEWDRLERPAWHTKAACRGHAIDTTTNIWFSDNPRNQTAAQAICGTCPVHTICDNHATAQPETQGIWAGVDRTTRRRTKKTTAAA